MPCPTTAHDLFEYVSSHRILLASMNAERNSLCPEDPRACGKRDLSRWSRKSAECVTEGGSRVRWRA